MKPSPGGTAPTKSVIGGPSCKLKPIFFDEMFDLYPVRTTYRRLRIGPREPAVAAPGPSYYGPATTAGSLMMTTILAAQTPFDMRPTHHGKPVANSVPYRARQRGSSISWISTSSKATFCQMSDQLEVETFSHGERPRVRSNFKKFNNKSFKLSTSPNPRPERRNCPPSLQAQNRGIGIAPEPLARHARRDSRLQPKNFRAENKVLRARHTPRQGELLQAKEPRYSIGQPTSRPGMGIVCLCQKSVRNAMRRE